MPRDYRKNYLKVSEITSKLNELVTGESGEFVKVFDLKNSTEPDGLKVRCAQIGKGDIPVLIVTGRPTSIQGVSKVLRKDASPEEILAAVEELLGPA